MHSSVHIVIATQQIWEVEPILNECLNECSVSITDDSPAIYQHTQII